MKPKFDANFLGTKLFISEVRCILSDLINYDCDLLQDDASKCFVSYIVLTKLPFSFRQELVRKCNDNYPLLQDVFDNYSEVIKTLLIRQNNNSFKAGGPSAPPAAAKPYNNKALVNAATSSVMPVKTCKFCNANHSMLKCTKYATYGSRVSRCKALKLCINCTSLKHESSACKKLDFSCINCKSNEHISALCPNLIPVSTNWCLNMAHSGGRTFILPTITIEVKYGKFCS